MRSSISCLPNRELFSEILTNARTTRYNENKSCKVVRLNYFMLSFHFFLKPFNTELLNCLRNSFLRVRSRRCDMYNSWHYQMQNCSIAHFSTEKWRKKIKKPIKDPEMLLKILAVKATLVYMRWISCSNKIKGRSQEVNKKNF